MTASSPSPPAPWARLAVTLALLAGIAALRFVHVGLPGVDPSGIASEVNAASSFSVFALGLMPLVSAMAIVELTAASVSRWRPLRHGGPVGRRKLGRATLVVTAVLCVFQGYGIARLLESLGVVTTPGLSSQMMVVLSLAAGTFFVVLLAQLAGIHGLVSGLAVLVVGEPVVGYVELFLLPSRREGINARSLAGFAAGALLTIVATWFVLRSPPARLEPDPEAPGYRARPDRRAPASIAIPAPASGVALLFIAGSALALVESLGKLGLPTGGLDRALSADARIHDAVSLLLIVSLGVGFTWLFNAPSRVAALAVRARTGGDEGEGGETGTLEAEARAGMRDATLRSVAFLAVLFAIGRVTHDSPSALANITSFALGTALVLDAAAEWRARRTLPDLVPVWPEHRPYALASAREALARAGIAVHARGESLRRLLQFAGPFVPIDLMVPRADAERAAGILDGLLRFHPEDDPGRKPAPPAKPRPWTRMEGGLLAAAVVLGGGSLLLPGAAPTVPRSRAPAHPEALQLLSVDDDDDLFDPPPQEQPAGVSISVENTFASPGRSQARHFARLVAGKGEGMEQARARLLAWAEKLAAARALQVRVQSVFEYDEQQERTERIGWRTYLVQGAPVIDGADVKSAVVEADGRTTSGLEGWHVRVELGPAGAERFRAFTASHVKRRLAIVVDGVVESAPVIQSEIRGGTITITMGSGSPEQQLADARRLEGKLLGEP